LAAGFGSWNSSTSSEPPTTPQPGGHATPRSEVARGGVGAGAAAAGAGATILAGGAASGSPSALRLAAAGAGTRRTWRVRVGSFFCRCCS